MENKQYVNLNMNAQEILNVSLDKLGAHPIPAELFEGRIWQLTTDNHVYSFIGGDVRQIVFAEDLNKFGTFAGTHDASSGLVPTAGTGVDLENAPDSSIEAGDWYRISVAGTITGLESGDDSLSPGDMLIALIDDATLPEHFMAIQANLAEGVLTNIYTDDGILINSDRTLTGNSFGLTLDQLQFYLVNVVSSYTETIGGVKATNVTGVFSETSAGRTITSTGAGNNILLVTDVDGAFIVPGSADPDTEITAPVNGMLKYSTSREEFRLYEDGVWRGVGGIKHAVNFAAFPTTGDLNIMYVADDTGETFLWDGAQYLPIGDISTLVQVQLAGKVIATHTDGGGIEVDILESITTLVDNGDGTYTYTNEDNDSTTIIVGAAGGSGIINDWEASTTYVINQGITAISPSTSHRTLYRRTTPGISGLIFNIAEELNWTAISTIGRAKFHADDTTVSPALVGSPTESEITIFAATSVFRDGLIYYTGDDLPGSPATRIYWIDSEGVATLIENLSSVDIITNWSASTEYLQNQEVTAVSPTTGHRTLYRRTAFGVSGLVFNVVEEGTWTAISTIGLTRLFADDTTVSPALAGKPTEAEIAIFSATSVFKDGLIYYTGDDTPGNPAIFTYWIDLAGVATYLNPFTESDPVFFAHAASNVISSGGGSLFLADDGTYRPVANGNGIYTGSDSLIVDTIVTVGNNILEFLAPDAINASPVDSINFTNGSNPDYTSIQRDGSIYSTYTGDLGYPPKKIKWGIENAYAPSGIIEISAFVTGGYSRATITGRGGRVASPDSKAYEFSVQGQGQGTIDLYRLGTLTTSLESETYGLHIQTGNVGIGVAPSSTDLLRVEGGNVRLEGLTNNKLFFLKQSSDTIGFGTSSPDTMVDIVGDISIKPSLTVVAATTNNLAVVGKSFVPLDNTAAASINVTGFTDGKQGKKVTFMNTSADDIVFTNEDVASTESNRFVNGNTAASKTLKQNDVIEYTYYGTRWYYSGGSI